MRRSLLDIFCGSSGPTNCKAYHASKIPSSGNFVFDTQLTIAHHLQSVPQASQQKSQHHAILLTIEALQSGVKMEKSNSSQLATYQKPKSSGDKDPNPNEKVEAKSSKGKEEFRAVVWGQEIAITSDRSTPEGRAIYENIKGVKE